MIKGKPAAEKFWERPTEWLVLQENAEDIVEKNVEVAKASP
jgi:hypothetical protein